MNTLPFLTASLSLVVLFPFALTTELNGELRMSIVRWAENKGKDVNRVVRQLDNSAINLEPNEPYFVHRKNNPLSRDESSEIIYRENITEPGTYSFNVTKKLSTTWAWSREHNMDLVLNVSQPVSIKVPDDSLVHVESLGKNFWEFKTPMSWNEAEATCRAAGLKLAQPKTRKEVEELQKVLHNRTHNRISGCPDETWIKRNGYCFLFNSGFMKKNQAIAYCESKKSILPFPALGDVAAWQEAVVDSITGKRSPITHAGALKELDGQWLWFDETSVQDEAWTPGKPTGKGDCSVIYPKSGMLIDKSCTNTWQTLCQAKSSNHWLGAHGSDDTKCVEWVDGKCIEDEDHETTSHIEDLWQTGKPGDLISSDYALLLQIEHEKPLTIMKTTERKPFLCESACPLGFVNRGSQCLLVQKVWQTWPEAQASCVKMGLQLYETAEKSLLAEYLHSQGFIETYWIGGVERSFTGKEVDMTKVKKLQFICELAHGTRNMNVTNQLSYSDQEKEFKLPKVVTPSKNCIVVVKERTITETHPFSVQMDITGWMWIEYSSPTDEHGSNKCDNNNDWVGGEECWAHSKWGYSTSYLQDGDQIMAQGDNARLTLNGTVTYTYNEHEVSVTECMSNDNNSAHLRSKRSIKGRRSKRSTASSVKKLKARAHSQDADDSNKPLMSYIGKRASEWVRAQAQERKAHLVAYTIDQLTPTVTDMKLEKEISELLTPGSIFEEEFENTGSESVITTFSKRKAVSNSYRWSVNKGLSIEDSHISSYSMKNTQSASNTFSLSNNIAQTEESSQAIRQDTTDELISKEGTSKRENIGSSKTDSITGTQTVSTGGSSSVSATQEDSVGSTDSSSTSKTAGTNTVGSQSSKKSDISSSSTSDTNTISQGSSTSDSQSSKKTKTDTTSESNTKTSSESSSQTNTKRKSNTKTDGNSVSTKSSSESSVKGSSGYNFLFVSAQVSFSAKAHSSKESTKTTESSSTDSSEDSTSSSKTSSNENTSSNSQSTASETGQTSQQSSTSSQAKSTQNQVGQQQIESTEEILSHGTSQTNQDTNTQARTATSTVGKGVENRQTFGNTIGTSSESNIQSSMNSELSKNYESSHGRKNSYGLENSVNQGRSKSYESAYGGDVTRGSQDSQEASKSRTQQVNIDRNEAIESSEEETLDTQNEVTIPPKTNVKIEWRVEQRKVRLPWKASIHMTGWINVRFNKSDDKVCDTYHDSIRNKYTNTRWTYNYTSPCEKDNRLYGYPLSYLKDKNFIQQGNGLRFVASGVFEAVVATSHYLRVTETALEPEYDDEDYNSSNNYYDDEPIASRRRKRDIKRLPTKVTDYHLEFDGHGNGRANIGRNNRYFRRFHATKKFN